MEKVKTEQFDKTFLITSDRIIDLEEILSICKRHDSCVLFSPDKKEETDLKILNKIKLQDSEGKTFPLVDFLKNIPKDKNFLDKKNFFVMYDGKKIPVEINISPLTENEDSFNGLITIRDLTEIRETEEKLNLFKNIFLEAQDGIAVIDSNGFYIIQNEAHKNLTGYDDNEILGKTPSISIGEEKLEEIMNTVKKEGKFRGTVKLRTKNGKTLDIDLSVFPVKDRYGIIRYYVGIKRDITDILKREEKLKELTEKLKKQLYTDPLTGLPNRKKLIEDIERSEEPKLAVLNINNFKEINDFYGQYFGDQLLKEVGKKLKDFAEDKNLLLYRNYGDEFIFLADKNINLKDFIIKIKNILRKIHTYTFKTDDTEVHIYMTAGFAEGKEKLISKADMALKYAKQHRKNVQIYNKSLKIEEQYKKNISMTKKIKEALENNKVTVYFQPILNNETLKIESYETLVRIKEDSGNHLLPENFLIVAKKSPIYPDITKVILDKTFEKIRNIDKKISLNLSIRDIENTEINELVIQFIKDNKGKIIIEILESESIKDLETVIDFIKRAKSSGAEIALDDFGSGYSNFELILKLDVDYIKIDASLIKNLHSCMESKIIVETIVNFAKKLNKKTVAEFVHSEEIFKTVKSLGVDYSQGYFIGEPKGEI
ncbi:EAL domain-containing protein [Persephonella sp.]